MNRFVYKTFFVFLFYFLKNVLCRSVEDLSVYRDSEQNKAEIERTFSDLWDQSSERDVIKASYSVHQNDEYTTICWTKKTTLHFFSNGTNNGYVEYSISMELAPEPLTNQNNVKEIEEYEIFEGGSEKPQLLNFVTVKNNLQESVKENKTIICKSDKIYAKIFTHLTRKKRVEIKLKPSLEEVKIDDTKNHGYQNHPTVYYRTITEEPDGLKKSTDQATSEFETETSIQNGMQTEESDKKSTTQSLSRNLSENDETNIPVTVSEEQNSSSSRIENDESKIRTTVSEGQNLSNDRIEKDDTQTLRAATEDTERDDVSTEAIFSDKEEKEGDSVSKRVLPKVATSASSNSEVSLENSSDARIVTDSEAPPDNINNSEDDKTSVGAADRHTDSDTESESKAATSGGIDGKTSDVKASELIEEDLDLSGPRNGDSLSKELKKSKSNIDLLSSDGEVVNTETAKDLELSESRNGVNSSTESKEESETDSDLPSSLSEVKNTETLNGEQILSRTSDNFEDGKETNTSGEQKSTIEDNLELVVSSSPATESRSLVVSETDELKEQKQPHSPATEGRSLTVSQTEEQKEENQPHLDIRSQNFEDQTVPNKFRCNTNGNVLVKFEMDISDDAGEIEDVRKDLHFDLNQIESNKAQNDFDKEIISLIRNHFRDVLYRHKFCEEVTTTSPLKHLFRSFQNHQVDYPDYVQDNQYTVYPSNQVQSFYVGPDGKYYIVPHPYVRPTEQPSLYDRLRSGVVNGMRRIFQSDDTSFRHRRL